MSVSYDSSTRRYGVVGVRYSPAAMAAGEDGLNELAEALSAHPSGAQLLPLLSEAASAEAAGRVRDASRYVVSIGAPWRRRGRTTLPCWPRLNAPYPHPGVRLVNGGNNIADFKLAERVFTFAVRQRRSHVPRPAHIACPCSPLPPPRRR